MKTEYNADLTEIHRLSTSNKIDDRWNAAKSLQEKFLYISDKHEALQNLRRLTQDKNDFVRSAAAEALGASFPYIHDKNSAWKDFVRLILDECSFVRYKSAKALGFSFVDIPDKKSAWNELHRLTQDRDNFVRESAAKAIGLSFARIPDKTSAWKDLHRLTQDQDISVRWTAAEAIGLSFKYIPNKKLAWQDLKLMTQDKDSIVRWRVAGAFKLSFRHIPDKDPDKMLAWHDIHEMIHDDDSDVRWSAAEALDSSFAYITDKKLAWEGLQELTSDKDSFVRWTAAEVVGFSFMHIPDKEAALDDLHRLSQDKDSSVRWSAAGALGSAFAHIPNKISAWEDLQRLTHDEDRYVRMYAYHSLGRASIYKATETEDRKHMLIELNAALEYFDKSTKEKTMVNPGRFCLHFYRSYIALTFYNAKNDEIKRYLSEAKKTIGGSDSKDELLRAVENLAQALQESKKLKGRSLEEIASELNTYRWYCDKAASHMATAEKGAPGVVKLMRKINPILEENIQATIAEIQKSARKICEVTHGSGTVYEAPGAELQKAAKGFSTGDLASVQNYSSKIVWQLKKFCELLSPEDKEQVCSIVEEIVHEADFPEKLHKILTALSCLSPILEESTSIQKDGEVLRRIEDKLDVIHKNTKHLGLYLNNIEFAILNLKDSTGNTKKYLLDIKNDVDRLQKEIEAHGFSEKELAIALEDKDHTLIERLTKMDENMCRAVREIVRLNAMNHRDLDAILDKLDEKDGLKKRDILGIISDISQLSQIGLKIYLTSGIII